MISCITNRKIFFHEFLSSIFAPRTSNPLFNILKFCWSKRNWWAYFWVKFNKNRWNCLFVKNENCFLGFIWPKYGVDSWHFVIIIRLIIWTIELNLCKNGIFYLKTCEGHNSGEWVVQYTKLLGPFLDNCSVTRYQGALYYDYFTEHFKRQTLLEFRKQLTLCFQENVFYFEDDLM